MGIVVLDEGEFPRLPGVIEMYRAALALVGGDASGQGTSGPVQDGVPEHPADAHQEHLRQAGRQQPAAALRQAAQLNLLSRTRDR